MGGAPDLILDFEPDHSRIMPIPALAPVDESVSPPFPTGARSQVLVVMIPSFIPQRTSVPTSRPRYRAERPSTAKRPGPSYPKDWRRILRLRRNHTDIEMPPYGRSAPHVPYQGERASAGHPLFHIQFPGQRGQLRKWKSLGADGILTKPDMPNLVSIIGEVLEQGRREVKAKASVAVFR